MTPTCHNELERFRSNQQQGQAAGLWLTLHLRLGEKPEETAEKFLAVLASWLSTAAELEQTQTDWPTDEQWATILPAWFIETFQGHTPQDILQSDWLWDYSSWLDSMQNRVWEWWGYQRTDSLLTIQLQLSSWPYSVGALKYLARLAGEELTVVEK